MVVAEAGNGSIIGEMALIDSLPRMATARANKDDAVDRDPKRGADRETGTP